MMPSASATESAEVSSTRDARLLAGVVVGTFVVLRVWLAITPNADLTVRGVNVHHLYTGILITTVTAVPLVLGVVRRSARQWVIALFGAGLAMMLDEWVYLIATDGSNASYSLPISRWGGLALVLLGATYAWGCGCVRGRGRSGDPLRT